MKKYFLPQLCALFFIGVGVNAQLKITDPEFKKLSIKADSVHIAFNKTEDINAKLHILKNLEKSVGSKDSIVLSRKAGMNAGLALSYAAQNNVKEAMNRLKLSPLKVQASYFNLVIEQLLAIGNVAESLSEMKKYLSEALGEKQKLQADDAYRYGTILKLYLQHLDHNTYTSEVAYYLPPLYVAEGKYFPSDINLRDEKPKVSVLDQFFFHYAKLLYSKNEKEKAAGIIADAQRNGSLPKHLIQGVCATLDNSGNLKKLVDKKQAGSQKLFNDNLAGLYAKPDINGKVWGKDGFKGKYVVLDFWGSWCAPCRGGHPDLNKLYDKYKASGLEIVGIAVEAPKDLNEAKAKWMEAVKQDGIQWVQLLNNIDVESFDARIGFNIAMFPTKIILDKEGKEIARFKGGAKEGFEQKLKTIFGF